MGGELNAATSRETTVVYTRVPDGRVEQALDAMADMVFAPPSTTSTRSARSCSRRSRWWTTTRRTSSTTSLRRRCSAAHPLGRPVIGRAEVIAGVSPRALRGYHGGAYVGPNIVLSAAGHVSHDRLVELFASRRAGDAERRRRASAARSSVASRSPGTGSCAGRPSSTTSSSARRDRARRPAALRRLPPRRDPRGLGLVAPVPGDPREARDGVQRLHVRLAVRGDGPDRRLRRHPGGQPRRVPRR